MAIMGQQEDSFREALRTSFGRAVPHAAALGITVDEITADYARASLPFREEWLGDPLRGVIHTGVIVSLVDSLFGITLLGRLGSFQSIATLDLRMDYLRPARRDLALHARSECYRQTASIAFLRATVWQADEHEPVATSQSAFMLSPHRPQRAVSTA